MVGWPAKESLCPCGRQHTKPKGTRLRGQATDKLLAPNDLIARVGEHARQLLVVDRVFKAALVVARQPAQHDHVCRAD